MLVYFILNIINAESLSLSLSLSLPFSASLQKREIVDVKGNTECCFCIFYFCTGSYPQ